MATNTGDDARLGSLARLGLEIPLLLAPMGGGFTGPAMVAAVSEAGGLGSLAAPYLQPEAITAEVAAVRMLTRRPFAINLFIFDPPTVTEAQLAKAVATLTPYCGELGAPPPEPPAQAHPNIDGQIEAMLAARPAVFSFTFGIPRPEVLAECLRRGIVTVGTATTLAEGLALEAAGVDVVCAQGS
ncbi:MAG: nitronate monooxygenase, partial [Caulobacteraceae bacterium]